VLCLAHSHAMVVTGSITGGVVTGTAVDAAFEHSVAMV